ncbi:hypothetical protein [Streptomyces pini]|uniref:Uncharacterized protein n=1 Tax=Streptomyces pini TaxID=1520580 RepID=A0A1I4G9H4_9ACTN|nr:hypothetical protein [Streptomyces pini]SFL25957.1 hypothetical protein SAMN05192584_115130 [Streptomyces pini]
MDPLHELLREEAGSYRPDRARMYARVSRAVSAGPDGGPGRSRVRARGVPWPRAALVALASTAALLAGAHVLTSPVREDGPAREVAAGPLPAAPGPDAARFSPAGRAPDAPSSGPLRSEGTVAPHRNAYRAQSNVTLTTREPLASLVLEVRIARTGGVRHTGSRRTLPEDDFTVTVRETGGALVYRWTLKEGRTVPAGRHVFAARYDHAAGARETAGDGYTATASATDGGGHTVRGSFPDSSG